MTDTHEQIVTAGLRRRAVEAAVWAMPAVNFEIMRSMMSPDGGNEFLYWSGLLDWRNQTLTPNPDLLYYMAFMDPGADGPLVLEIPPGQGDFQLNGNVCTIWQVPLEDVGRYGADKGEGGRYLILPPGYDGDVPDGFIVLQSDVRRVYALLRTVLPEATQEAVDRALEFCEGIRIYPLAEAADPPETPRRDLQGVEVDTRIPYDMRFWEALDRVVQVESWLPRDRPFADILASIGIVRGEAFEPDADRVALLESALDDAHDWLRDDYQHEPVFYEGRQWFFPATADFAAAQGSNFADDQVYPYTCRGVIYHMAFIGLKRIGSGQFYLVNLRDSDGELLRSDLNYRMRVPAGVPVSQYWSVAMYDGDDHTFIRGNTKYSVASIAPGLTFNDDGSIDVYFGPTPPAGLEANWIDTGDSTTFELMFRFYGVSAGLLEKTFQLEDVVRVS
ncbi:DUF1254 domain-containing protein [Herbiconiux sp. CPCC 203407]|uniref:DUF1254 domain-containing protein n=1 Tax=Herbiconiux oxytropis TaxID=2970915 RepID=A0AA42BVG0_9MICO|nr:DUF1254 domain-containing protein [Herbiconiux oxytropis]MCS5721763.1 DUF1254 domain-containing protein [Herbiconiux oxytropis]MCS5727987.1 DUF1254 domain-containing protein [Herbiconiux oxytropis]